MTKFNVNLSSIKPKEGEVIIVKFDLPDIPFSDLEDYCDTMHLIRNAFPKNNVVFISKNDEISIQKEIA